LRSYGDSLRRRLRADGVSVAVVVPRSSAIGAAARLHEPGLTLAGADRIAERIARGLSRRGAAVAIPGPATLAMRTLRVVPSRVRDAARTMLLPSTGAIREPAEEGPLPGESGPGD
jgi:short-subunit dehydrogenase